MNQGKGPFGHAWVLVKKKEKRKKQDGNRMCFIFTWMVEASFQTGTNVSAHFHSIQRADQIGQ